MPGSPANAIFHPLSGGSHPLGKSRIVIPAPSAEGGLGDEAAWWCPTLDDSPNDISANGNDGTYQGGMGTVPDVQFGGTRAYEFDGTDDGILCSGAYTNALSGAIDYTSSFWINRTPTQLMVVLANTFDAGPERWSNQVQTGTTVYNQAGNALTTHFYSPSNIGVWSHLCFRTTGTVIEVFIDGTLSTSGPLATEAAPVVAAEDLQIGWYNSANQFRVDGRMDDIRIFNRALTQAEITHLASARGVLGPAP